jgi:hypothetical protein
MKNIKKILDKNYFHTINIFIGPEGGFSLREQRIFENYYDNEKNLLVLAKFQSPQVRTGIQQVAIKLDF